MSRAALLEICLGIGILAGDAEIIQFYEGGYPEGTPDYICSSSWDVGDYDKFQEYTGRLNKDILGSLEPPRYV